MGKIKFKLSVKELSFEFEGDQETGQRFQNSISKTLNSLTETPNQIIDVEARTIEDNFLLSAPQQPLSKNKRKRSGKKAKNSENLTDGQNGLNGNNSTNERVVRNHRPKGQSAMDLTIVLIQEGFFNTYRSSNDIVGELAKKGHNFNSSTLSTALIRITQKGYLERDNSSGNWQYIKGKTDVPTGS